MESKLNHLVTIEMNVIEEWLPVKDFPMYEISSIGNLRRGKKIRSVTPNKKGYVEYHLQDKTRERYTQAHILVAETFIDNPENKPWVDHVNRIRHDNRKENLRWVTPLENSKNRKTSKNPSGSRAIDRLKDGKFLDSWESATVAGRTLNIDNSQITACCRERLDTAGGFQWRYKEQTDHPGEEWKAIEFRGVRLEASTFGRIRSERGIYKGTTYDGGYQCVTGDHFPVHRIICEAFKSHERKEGQTMVNHLDSNPSNNHIDNLVWATPQENTQHAYEHGKMKRLKRKIEEFDDNGITTQEFDSLTSTAKTYKMAKSSVFDKIQKGVRFRYKRDPVAN
jgi:hypothetical protein